jgi:hypothetical protein
LLINSISRLTSELKIIIEHGRTYEMNNEVEEHEINVKECEMTNTSTPLINKSF